MLLLPSRDQTAQTGENIMAVSQSKKEKSIKMKDAAFSAEDKAICAVTAKKEMMARAKKIKPAKQTLKKLQSRSQMMAMCPQNSCPMNPRNSWVK